MLFYCPNCRKEYDVKPRETITTKSNRVAYKADCPVCGQDMAEFVPEDTTDKAGQEYSDDAGESTPQPESKADAHTQLTDQMPGKNGNAS